MKKIFLLLLLAFAFSCKPKPEFYINGKPCYTQTYCVKDTTYTTWQYHYGYWFGKYQWYYGPDEVEECLEWKTDTIEIKKEDLK